MKGGNALMHVSLTPELENLVKKQVESGRYHSSSEVVREALRLWEEQEKLRELRMEQFRKDIQAGLESGPAKPLEFEDIKKRGRERIKSKNKGR
jgi:antitoxin ParD1/3/4